MTTTSKETKAFYRLVVTDASKTKKVVVWEGHSSHFNPANGNAATYPAFEADMQKLPIIPKGIGGVLREDDYLLIEAKDDGSTQSQLIATNQALRIPVTKRNRRTGIVSEQILSPTSFTVTTDFAAADMSATYWRDCICSGARTGRVETRARYSPQLEDSYRVWRHGRGRVI